MGIKKLNKLLSEYDLIKYYSSLDNLLNYLNIDYKKKVNYVAIDTNIYLYKFINIRDNDYYLILFKNQIKRFISKNIIPIYVFDTNCIDDKYLVINKRKKNKFNLQERNELRDELRDELKDELQDIQTCNISIDKSKRHVNVDAEHIRKLKKFFDYNNIPYIDSPTESDFLCSNLVKQKIAFACLSDDIDLLVLGCNYLIKFNKGEYILYDYKYILEKLELDTDKLINLSIFLGCDYYLQLNPSLNHNDILKLVKTNSYNNIIKENADLDYHTKYYPTTYYYTLTEIINFSLYSDDNENILNTITDNFNNAKAILTLTNTSYNIIPNIINFHNSILLITIKLNARNY